MLKHHAEKAPLRRNVELREVGRHRAVPGLADVVGDHRRGDPRGLRLLHHGRLMPAPARRCEARPRRDGVRAGTCRGRLVAQPPGAAAAHQSSIRLQSRRGGTSIVDVLRERGWVIGRHHRLRVVPGRGQPKPRSASTSRQDADRRARDGRAARGCRRRCGRRRPCRSWGLDLEADPVASGFVKTHGPPRRQRERGLDGRAGDRGQADPVPARGDPDAERAWACIWDDRIGAAPPRFEQSGGVSEARTSRMHRGVAARGRRRSTAR